MYFKHASLPREARYCRQSCGTDKIIWVMQGQLAYGLLTQHYTTDIVAPLRLSLFALLTAPQNPNITLHTGPRRVLEGYWKGPGVFRPIRCY